MLKIELKKWRKKMKIKEFKLISKENNGTFPQLKCVAEYEVIYDDMFIYLYHDNYEFEYIFFGEVLKLQDNYLESCYVMSYDGANNPIGIFLVSSGGKSENIIYYDNILTYLLLSGSKSFITIHNHPNNIFLKSPNDISIDNSIKEISEILNIEFKDGLIITKEIIDKLHEKMKKYEQDYFNDDESILYEELIDKGEE